MVCLQLSQSNGMRNFICNEMLMLLHMLIYFLLLMT
jgi:hypothetical protein